MQIGTLSRHKAFPSKADLKNSKVYKQTPRKRDLLCLIDLTVIDQCIYVHVLDNIECKLWILKRRQPSTIYNDVYLLIWSEMALAVFYNSFNATMGQRIRSRPFQCITFLGFQTIVHSLTPQLLFFLGGVVKGKWRFFGFYLGFPFSTYLQLERHQSDFFLNVSDFKQKTVEMQS